MTKKEQPEEVSKKSMDKPYQKPQGQTKQWTWNGDKEKWDYTCLTDWILIREKEKPVADVFFTYYFKDQEQKLKKNRPISFIFNGGPGASSAYLHVGAMGPKKIAFGQRGECLAPPAELKDNPETWLDFTDLVFVDPVGTGFSRSLEEIDLSPPGKQTNKVKKQGQEFYKINRDLNVLGEFIQRFLSQYRRWSSPVFIAGESYGGFRVAKLSRKLQEKYGVGICGAILISPALELNHLMGSDYDSLYWLESFPTMTATAVYHQKSAFFNKGRELFLKQNLNSFLKPAEIFALNELNQFLVQGENMSAKSMEEIIKKIISFIGIPFEKIQSSNGRINIFQFCRLLLKEERKWCGIYDTSITSYDPFPSRDYFEGADPTLYGIEHAFTHGINTLFREHLEILCERNYHLLSLEVNQNWKQDDKNRHVFNLHIGSTDDLRYAMAMNPNMKVFIGHGVFDLVTPYFSSQRIVGLMKLPASLKRQISFNIYHGGHMFYTWSDSRKQFKEHIKKLYNS